MALIQSGEARSKQTHKQYQNLNHRLHPLASRYSESPRMAQKRSEFSDSLALTIRPSATTTVASMRQSIANPCCPLRKPNPPPMITPPTPGTLDIGPTLTKFSFIIASSKSAHVQLHST